MTSEERKNIWLKDREFSEYDLYIVKLLQGLPEDEAADEANLRREEAHGFKSLLLDAGMQEAERDALQVGLEVIEERIRKQLINDKKCSWQELIGKGTEFEKRMAKLFRNLGYYVEETGEEQRGKRGEGGIDLLLSKGREEIIVECRARRRKATLNDVKATYATLNEQRHNGVNHAIFVSIKGYQSGARSYAKDKPLTLLDLDGIVELELNARLYKRGLRHLTSPDRSFDPGV